MWFNPQEFDKIIICFLARGDKPQVTTGRMKMLEIHPLKHKIICLNLFESNYRVKKENYAEHHFNYITLQKKLLELNLNPTEIYTHNPWGEYGHPDHILVHQAVVATFGLKSDIYCFDGIEPTTPLLLEERKIDLAFYNKVKKLYQDNNCWTWDDNYMPKETQHYFKVI